ncbi:hypothetical protein JCGZ_24784 [Jatropha curcas]|uniref:Uncharacterized protein n=1 Tax=Jatropha curcas TaxID=180498 RepID=A0A067L8H2_JATCU|nr:hypothetical protein JCGZ_24784 [Jatropha curcas]
MSMRSWTHAKLFVSHVVPLVQVPASVPATPTVLSPTSPASPATPVSPTTPTTLPAPMASISDFQTLIKQLEARMEARMNEALAAQRAALIAELGNAKKMLPGLEIFADTWDNRPETITELEVEDFMQPSLFDEVAVITGDNENRDLLSLIEPNKGPLTNWYTEEERTADKPPPKSTLVPESVIKSCTESESDPESETKSESSSSSESSVSDLEDPDFKFDPMWDSPKVSAPPYVATAHPPLGTQRPR